MIERNLNHFHVGAGRFAKGTQSRAQPVKAATIIRLR